MHPITREVAAVLVALPLSRCVVAAAAPKPIQYLTYHVNELFLTPFRVKTTDDLGDSSRPASGTIFLVVSFHAVNKDDVENEVSKSDFRLRAGNRSLEPDPFASTVDQLAYVVIQPGARLDGSLVFKVTRSTHAGVLSWMPKPPQEVTTLTYPVFSWNLQF
jgi:hypothetical protein